MGITLGLYGISSSEAKKRSKSDWRRLPDADSVPGKHSPAAWVLLHTRQLQGERVRSLLLGAYLVREACPILHKFSHAWSGRFTTQGSSRRSPGSQRLDDASVARGREWCPRVFALRASR